MSYELIVPPYVMRRPMYGGIPWAYARGHALGAAAGEAGFNPACVAWADQNYHFAAFDAKRRTVEQFIRDNAPAWPVAHAVGRAVDIETAFAAPGEEEAWVDLERLGGYTRGTGKKKHTVVRKGPQRTERVDIRWAWKDYHYTLYLRKAAYFLWEAANFLKDLGALVNLPVYWLFPTDPTTVAGGGIHDPIAPKNDGARFAGFGMNHLVRDPVGLVSGYYEGEERPFSKGKGFLPVSLLTGRAHFSGLPQDGSRPNPRTYDNPSKGEESRPNANDLADFWKAFLYKNTPYNEESNPRGFPPGFKWARGGPPAALVTWSKPWGSAERDFGKYRLHPFLGPIVSVHTAIQTLKLACSRPSNEVVGNAFQSWGRILEVWAASPNNAAPAEAKNQMKVAGAAMGTAGATLTAAGALSANPFLAGAGVAVSFLAELAKILPTAEASLCLPGPGFQYQGGRSRKGLGKLCSPPEPLLVRPPAGCAPGMALALDEARKKAAEPTSWDKFLAWLKEYGPFIGVGVGGLLAAYVAFRLIRNPTQRRMKRRNTSGLFRVYDKNDPRFLMLTFESGPEAIAYARGTVGRQRFREMWIDIREGGRWRPWTVMPVVTWGRLLEGDR